MQFKYLYYLQLIKHLQRNIKLNYNTKYCWSRYFAYREHAQNGAKKFTQIKCYQQEVM